MTRSILLAVGLSAIFAVGCGDDDDGGSGNQAKCDQGNKILEDCNMSESKVEGCSAPEAAVSQCAIDHPKGACYDGFDDDPEQDAYLSCVFSAAQ